MSDSVTVLAPAKINLGLEVFPRRADGYHDIRSIFLTVGLFDELTVSKAEKRNFCSVECEEMELPKHNTITEAYKAFCVLTGIDVGVRVSLKKRLPSGGGLGGGSSDASSFIQSVDSLFHAGLDQNAILNIAGKVGSDVFFFSRALLETKKESCFIPFSALVEGRGEKVSPIECRKDLTVLLVFPEVQVSTALAYGLLDEISSFGKREFFPLEEMYRKPVHKWKFLNDFTLPVSEKYPLVAEALASVRECGADFSDMSGSGSTVFGVFESREAALDAERVLGLKYKTVIC